MQIVLPANFVTQSISAIIVRSRIVEQIVTQEWERNVTSRFSKGGMPFGAGYKQTFELDLNPVNDRLWTNGTNNPYAYENKKEFKEGVLYVDNHKFTHVTYDTAPTTNQSFESDTLVQEYLALTLNSNTKTIDEFFSELCVKEWNDSIASAGLQATQTITIDLFDITSATDVQAARQENSIRIKEAMDKILTSITVRSTKYTNDPTINTKFDRGKTYAIFNKAWIRHIASGGVSMFNSEVINYMLPELNRLELPDEKVTNPNVIATLQTDERFALLDGYRIGVPLLNPLTLLQTNFEHFQYGIGHFEQAPFIRIMANPTVTYRAPIFEGVAA